MTQPQQNSIGTTWGRNGKRPRFLCLNPYMDLPQFCSRSHTILLYADAETRSVPGLLTGRVM